MQTAIGIIEKGFRDYRDSIICTNARIDDIILSGASVLARRNGGPSLGPRSRFNFIEGSGVTLTLTDDPADQEFDLIISATGGGGGAPTNAAYVVMSLDATLTNERRLQVASPITLLDGGANADVTIGFDQTINLDNNARVTVRRNTGANVGTRRRLNFIEGTGITIVAADDAIDEEVDITLSATATTGPQGPPGPQGEDGLQGDMGPMGLQGLPGLQGLAGQNGMDGMDGDPGPTGLQGLPGTAGLRGAQGEEGYQGEQGLPGGMNTPVILSIANGFRFREEFLGGLSEIGDHCWAIETVAGVSTVGANQETTAGVVTSSHAGVIYVLAGFAGEAPNGLETCIVHKDVAGLVVGAGLIYEACVRPQGVEGTPASNSFAIYRIGIGDTITSIRPVNGVWLEIDPGSSANWRISTSDNNTQTITSSSITVNSNQWYRVRFEVDPSGASIAFSLSTTEGGPYVSLGTINTNIPGSTRVMGLFFQTSTFPNANPLTDHASLNVDAVEIRRESVIR